MDEDGWDLEAVVRGCRRTARSAEEADPFSFLPLVAKKEKEDEENSEDIFGRLSEIFPAQRGVVHELEELCKPFFTKSSEQHQKQQFSPERKPAYLSSQHEITQPQARSFTQTPRVKRRKNQQKKVVRQVPIEGPSDMWAWRKYGQKPIKGSPYPRGYYRCSSSKGCLARKQVERSTTEQETLIITYTGEHNHPVPTHRNSLAGSSRQKLPSSSSSSKAMSAELSPTTPLTSSMEDELLFPPRQKTQGEEVEEEEEEEDDEDEENLLFLADMEILKDDDFVFSDSSPRFGAAPIQWVPGGAATAAGGG